MTTKSTQISKLFLAVVVLVAIFIAAPATANEDKTSESPDIASEALVIFVDDDAPDGGDGSEAQPYNQLNRALERTMASSSPIEIHIAEGEYDSDLPGMFTVANSNDPVTIRGAGIEKTVLRDMITVGSYTDARFSVSDLSIVMPQGSDDEPTTAMMALDSTLEVSNILIEADYGIHTLCGTYHFNRRPPCPTSKISQSVIRYTSVGFGNTPHNGGNYSGPVTIDQTTFINTMPKYDFGYGVAHTIEYIDSTAVAINRESSITHSVLDGVQSVYLFNSGWMVEISDVLADGPIVKLDPENEYDPTTRNMVVVEEVEFMDDYGRLPQGSPAIDASASVTDPDGTAGDWGAWGGENPIGQTVWATLGLTAKDEAGAQYSLDMHKMFADGNISVSVQVSHLDSWVTLPIGTDTETSVSFYVNVSNDEPTFINVKATVTYDDSGQTVVQRFDCFNCHTYHLPIVVTD